jgi:peptidoglycan/xylan/chitin deacetylase (PgdA/CDA1 family)
VAVPHVTNLLIAEDCSATELKADEICLESWSHRRYFHDTSDEIDDLVMRIMGLASAHVICLILSHFDWLIVITAFT